MGIISKILAILAIIFMAFYLLAPKIFGEFNPMAMMGGAMPVMVAEVVQKDITVQDEFSGRLKAVDDVQVRPRVAGMVQSVHFKDGDTVKEGDLLFIIDPKPYEAEAQAARARAELAEAEFKRASSLFADKAISQRDYDQRKNAASVARADLKRAELQLGYTKVKAPVSGKAGRVEVTTGNLVDVGMPVMTTVVSQSPIYADFDADEQRFLSYLSVAGNDATKLAEVAVTLELANGKTYTGHVHSFDNQLNTASGSIRVRAVFDNPQGELVPGLFARLHMAASGNQPAILVAEKSINTDQNKKFVYVVTTDDKGSTINYREVKLGTAYNGLRVITSGLEKGDMVVVSNSRFLRPAMPVIPNKVGMEETDKHEVPSPSAQDTSEPKPDEPAEQKPVEAAQ